MLEITNVSAAYDVAQVVHDVSCRVREGEIVSLLGRNGAGKTTLLRSIIGIHAECSGSVKLDDQEISGWPAYRRAKEGIGYIPDDRGIYSRLSVEEHLRLVSPCAGGQPWALSEIYGQFPVLYKRRRTCGTNLSGGEQQMLAMARVLRMGAQVLLCDEITEGLAPAVVDELGDVLVKLRSRGISILVVEQNWKFVSGLADRHYIIVDGAIKGEFPREKLHEHVELLNKWLGV